MTLDLTILSMAKGLAAHSGRRQSLISENIANADTREFRARDLKPFSEVYEGGDGGAFAAKATRTGHAGYSESATPPGFRPVHIAKLGADSPNGNNVSLEDQMSRGAQAALHHDMAVTILKKTMDLLRMGIGRGR